MPASTNPKPQTLSVPIKAYCSLFTVHPHLEEEENDEQARFILRQLRELDLDLLDLNLEVGHVPDENPYWRGAKGGGGPRWVSLIGAIRIQINPDEAMTLRRFLADWLTGAVAKLELDAKDRKLALQTNGQDNLGQVIQQAEQFVEQLG